jgi:thiamine biosynthesis protein ThiI
MKAVALISGGIDSPVAVYMMAMRGVDITLLHMDNRPYGAQGSVLKTSRMIAPLEKATGKKFDFFYAPHGRNNQINAEKCRPTFQCVLCKRQMLRTAKGFAERIGADAIVTGESLGQVASQTLQNLRAETVGIDFPILRPLIGLDKIEIEFIGKQIGTYEISISHGKAPACTIVPERPITMARPERILEEEMKIDVPEQLQYALDNIRSLKDLDKESS